MAEDVSRRSFLKVGLVGGAAALAGVGVGSVVGSTLRQSEVDRLQGEVNELRDLLDMPPLVDQVNIYNWSEYIADGLHEIFRQQVGTGVNYVEFESTDEVWAGLAAGTSDFDVVMLTDYLIPDAIELGLVQALPRRFIPNMKFIADKYRDPSYDPGNEYSAPYLWGTTGIGWNEDVVDEPVTGWGQMFDTSSGGFLARHQEAGVTMIDDVRETIGAALKFLGHSMNSMNPSHLEEAEALLLDQKPFLTAYADATTYIPALANGTFAVSHAWNGDVFVAAEDSEEYTIRYTIPEEGGTLWVDNMVIPANAPNPETAAAWVNFILRPEVVAHITNWRFYANPNSLADTLVNPSVLEDPEIYPPDEVLARLEIFDPLTEEELDLLDEIWERIRAGG